jgi:hypothetical protein
MPVSLDNLQKIGQLKKHPVNDEEIARLLAAAERSLADARATTISAETRFDAAYRAITQIGLAALMSCGFRPDTSRPGHHITIIQTLALTLGIEGPRVTVLDTLRRKRNLADYTGDEVDDASVDECIKQTERLLREARRRIGKRI